MRVKAKLNRMLLVAGGSGTLGLSVAGLRLETQTSGCPMATSTWEVLK